MSFGEKKAMFSQGATRERHIRVPQYAGWLRVVWSVAALASLAWSYYAGREAALEAARAQAHSAHDRDLVYRDWCVAQGGVWVPQSSVTPANPSLAPPSRELLTTSGLKLVLIDHAHLTRQVYEMAQTAFGERGHMTSLTPTRAENRPDAWERAALQKIERGHADPIGLDDIAALDTVEGTEYMRLMHPLRMQQSCTECHDQSKHPVGSYLGGISVGVPMAPFWSAERKRFTEVAGAHGMFWLLGMLSIGVGSRRLGYQVRKRAEAEAQLRDSNAELDAARLLLKDAFGRYVDPNVVTEILAQKEPLCLGGERRTVTVLMSDIRGFTAIAERMDPQELVSILNIYFTAMVDIVLEHGGGLDKFMGDALIGLFGAPLSHEDDALRAVRAALAMQDRVKELNARFAAEGRPQISVGVGIATGDVVVGNIGSEKRHDYTAIGAEVNIAKRLEALTKELPADILVSQSTYDLIRKQVIAVDFGLQAIRGMEETVRVYGITGLAS